jgi:hypothetical protein
MRINKFLFPLILLVIFIDTIALGMALGYWKTKGGGRHHHDSGTLTPIAVPAEVQTVSSFPWEQSQWRL